MSKMVKPEIRAGAGMQVRRTRHLQPGGAIQPHERHLKSKRTADTPNGAADDSMKIEGKAVARFKGCKVGQKPSATETQKPLSQLLDEIDERTEWKLTLRKGNPGAADWGEIYFGNGRSHRLLLRDAEIIRNAHNQTNVPALVKALRRANEIISECDPDTVYFWKVEVAAVLNRKMARLIYAENRDVKTDEQLN